MARLDEQKTQFYNTKKIKISNLRSLQKTIESRLGWGCNGSTKNKIIGPVATSELRFEQCGSNK